MFLTAVNIKLVAFCSVSPYGVTGATVLKGFELAASLQLR